MVENIQSVEKNKVLAGISYLLLFLNWIGLLIDVIIYYKAKDKYAKFHAGQACFLQLLIVIVGLIISLGVGVFFIFNPIGITSSSTSPGIIQIFTYITSAVYIILAIAAFMGKGFRIPIAAHLLEK